jgi:DNA-binding transcriptional ArsR family regulator
LEIASKLAFSDTDAQLVAIFSALGEPLRMEIIKQMTDVDVLACVTLEETLPISKSTISYHVKILYHANLIHIHKKGRYYFYRLRRDVLDQFLPGFLERISRENAARQSEPDPIAAEVLA